MPQSVAILTTLAFAFMGCAAVGKVNPSGDYVRISGLACTSPQMVDGNPGTGDTVYIEATMGSGDERSRPRIHRTRICLPLRR